MKKGDRSFLFIGAMLSLLLFGGCASQKANYHRGWIGGTYLEADPSFFKRMCDNYFEKNRGTVPALPDAVREGQKSAVLVSRVYQDTPAAAAGIREGDLIVGIGDTTIDSIVALRRVIDNTDPGKALSVLIWRDGEIIKTPVIAGKETYQKWNSWKLGFRLGTQFDPLPKPDFSLFAIVSYMSNDNRLELHSPEFQYFKKSSSDEQAHGMGGTSYEGWDLWLVFFGFGGQKVILSQEAASSD